MLGLNLCIVALTAAVVSALRVARAWFRRPRGHRRRLQLSSGVPSVTESFWAETLFSWSVALKHPKDLLPCFMDLIRRNGPVVHFNLFNRSYVLLNDPDDIKVLLSSNENIDKGPEYEMLRPWLNEGLLLSSGTKWQNRRKLFAKNFHFKTLDMYNYSINKNSRVLVRKLLEASANKKRISNVMKHVTLCSLDIIGETITGTNMKAQDGNSPQYVKSIKRVCISLIERVSKFWFWNDSSLSESSRIFHNSVRVLHEHTDDVILKKRARINDETDLDSSPENGHEYPRGKSLLDKLLSVLKDSPEQMTDNDIREEVSTFFFAGLNKSSTAISMTLLLLGMHRNVQDRARDELYAIFGDSDRDVTAEDLNAMKYVDAIIKETLRLYPSVPHITRTLREPLKLKNYTIPPTTIVAIYPYILHRNEDMYPKPDEFIPERFLDEAKESKFAFGYLPFSAGARDCIGQKYALNEIKIVVSNILRKTKIETYGSKEDIHIRMEIIIGIDSVPKMKFFEI